MIIPPTIATKPNRCFTSVLGLMGGVSLMDIANRAIMLGTRMAVPSRLIQVVLIYSISFLVFVRLCDLLEM